MSQRFELALRLAKEAGKYAKSRKYNCIVSDKGTSDSVTDVDVTVEKMITAAIKELFPNDAIQAEELAPKIKTEPRWIIDPIDGTKNYSHDLQMWSVCIAYKDEENGNSFGVCYFPDIDELFCAEQGKGAFLNDKPIHVSTVKKLQKAYTHIDTFHFQASKRILNERWPLYKSLFNHVFRVRNVGVASYSLCYVAKGSFDLNIDITAIPHEWDYFPSMVIIREAGGVYETNAGIAFAGNEVLVRDIQKVLKKEGLLESS